jgi:hypothetical protein
VGGWIRLYNEVLHNVYTTPNTIREIESRRMRLVGHVACMGDEKCIQYFSWKAWREKSTQKT